MKLPIFLSVSALVTSSFLVACSATTPVSSSSVAPVTSAAVPVPAQTSDVVPELDVAASTLDCSTYSADAITFIRQQADVLAGDVQYRVATLACGEPASEVSAEVVEAFVLENGAWASVGLVSGSDVPFNTMDACESDNTTITCPAFTYSEEGEAGGRIEITQQDNGLVWTFVAE
ncbi:MAG: hypothetical protein QNM01_07155 [Actinomycetes bacterium]